MRQRMVAPDPPPTQIDPVLPVASGRSGES
jgi:hypothetical protein